MGQNPYRLVSLKYNKHYKSVSQKYRSEGKGHLSKEEVEAYYVARMPATQAAVGFVLNEVKERLKREIKSVLDLGAGLGAGAMAARDVFDADQFTLVESNDQMVKKGQALFEGQWIHNDICKARFTLHDLVLLSYSFGEISSSERGALLKKAWDAAQVLVVVEPGTPKGYESVLEARDCLIKEGGHLLAPCPHTRICPMKGSEQWCHFSVAF